MRTLLDDAYAPVTSEIGFLETSVEDFAQALGDWTRSLRGDPVEVREREFQDPFPDILHRLEPLRTAGSSRDLLVPMGSWTAYFDNGFYGTDSDSVISVLSARMGCRGLRITSIPHTYRPKQPAPRGRMGAIQFALYVPPPLAHLDARRGLEAVFDGDHWVFITTGVEQPFEEPEAYAAKRKRDRFTSAMLERYCQAVGVDVFNEHLYGPGGVMIEIPEKDIPGGRMVKSLAEVQEWIGIKPGESGLLPG